MQNSWLLQGGTLVPIAGAPVVGDLLVVDGRIAEVGTSLSPRGSAGQRIPTLDVRGCIVMPGLVQAHVHLCQTLLRGGADDLTLLQWLRQRVWPYEAALSETAIQLAAQLASAELLLSGTTAILDMGTVHHQDALCETVAHIGIRATVGKAMMDLGEGVPAGLLETTESSLAESERLCRRWHGAAEGRIRYAYAPRFVLSCSDRLLRGVAERVAAGREAGVRLHTHASEQVEEAALVRERLGADNIAGLVSMGLGGQEAVFAHCVHVDEGETRALVASGTHVAHCPSSNLKLGSGIARIPELLAAGVNVALGADGAPCNNNLDGFVEMRLASLLQKGRLGPRSMPARVVLEMATLGGARALGLADQIGTLEPGKKADVIVVDPRVLHAAPLWDVESALVYALRGGEVRHVLVEGHQLVKDFELTGETGLDKERIVNRANEWRQEQGLP